MTSNLSGSILKTKKLTQESGDGILRVNGAFLAVEKGG